MTARRHWLVLGFALIGLGFALAASYVHYRLITDPTYVSPCDVNAKFNCSQVYLSRFGAVAGVPVALGGVIWFAAVALLTALSKPRPNDPEDPVGSYLFALSTVGLAAILYFAVASFFILKTGCILCIGTYVSVVAIFITTGTSPSIKMSRLPGRLFSDIGALLAKPLQLIAALLFVISSVSLVACFPKEGTGTASGDATKTASGSTPAASDDPQKRFEDLWAAQPRVDLGIPAGGAKVVVVKFNDWQCPSCKASYYAYKPIIDKYLQSSPGSVKYVTKDYPLNRRCNFNIAQENHAAACEASAAVRLARVVGKEDDMVTWLFNNQATLTPASVSAQVKTMLGLDLAKETPSVIEEIKRDAADGGALQVQFTPTYYINGVKAQTGDGSWLPAQYFDYAIQYEMKKAGAGGGK